MDYSEYIQHVLSNHLLHTDTYTQLSASTAQQHEMHKYLLYLFENYFASTQNSLSNTDKRYFSRSFHEQSYRTPTFYGLIKIHKTPWKICPVVSCCGSLLARVSTWVDFHLQRLQHLIPSFIKDSEDLQNQLSNLTIPPDTKLFTCNAISMYTNIDVNHSIFVMSEFFSLFRSELPPDFPTSLIISAISIIMKNNVFSFGDTFWLQKTGTAMGTPYACMLAMLYFGFHERTKILPTYTHHILFFQRFINNVICLWHSPTNDSQHSANQFQLLQTDMNNFGKLKWEFQPLSQHTTFLDLNIYLSLPHISFSTFQKPHNLYLYIPPHSAHPPGITRSLIYGLLRKYWIQNTSHTSFCHITRLLFQPLIARGHCSEYLTSLFIEAAHNLDRQNRLPTNASKNSNSYKNDLFLKWRYHPLYIPQRSIRHSYRHTCEMPSFGAPKGFRYTLTRAPPYVSTNSLLPTLEIEIFKTSSFHPAFHTYRTLLSVHSSPLHNHIETTKTTLCREMSPHTILDSSP